ncbi:TnsA endonuclease N-terminal domain-containing protein [Paracoccus yeei]|uniref:TnsA endonuclease N-terminal domain-containing protein n=1 Tax=Paracoccus yeei TaxID=147645 RepID=UPI0009DCC9F8|nr:TnsA endonuclease N-terminal domain-containing protein [Paracoccus yeei]
MTQSHFTGGTIVPPAPSLASRGGVVGKHHFTGELVADFSGARVVYFESHLEMQVLEVLRARSDVADVAEQPPRVAWRDGSGVVRHHTFDFLVTLRSGERVAVAVKPAARVISSGVRVALAEIAAQIDPAFAARIVLVTDRDTDPVEVRNATLLNRLGPVCPDALAAVTSVVRTMGGASPIGAIAKASGAGCAGARAVLSLVRDGALAPHGRSPITPDTLVAPTGVAA